MHRGIEGGNLTCVYTVASLGERLKVRAFNLYKKSILQAASKTILLIPDPERAFNFE